MEIQTISVLFFGQLIEAASGLTMLIFGLALMALYMLPFVIAFLRGHPATLGIFLVNLFLGWSVVGWIVALFWAVSAVGRPAV